jgi:hypothetical protein
LPPTTISSRTTSSPRFGAASEVVLREQVAKAFFSKGLALGQLDRREDAIAVYGDLVARFGSAGEWALREKVARALFFKGLSLCILGRSEEEIAVYDDVIARFGADDNPALKAIVENARGALCRRRLTAPAPNPNRDNPSSFRADNWAETGGRSGEDR